MQDDKWEALKEELKRKFKVEDEHFEDLMVETSDGMVKQGRSEVIIFSASGREIPFSKVKLVRESRPVVTDKKFIYSHRAGQAARTEYEFSDTEFSHKIKAYKWDDDSDEWKEIDAAAISN